jgi:HEAT repeat protein
VQLADRIRHLDQAYNETLAEFVAAYDKMCSAREVEWKVLVQAIDDKDVKVRVWTVRTLGELGYREALVETALRDADPGVRRAAQESLEKILTSPGAKPSAQSGARSNTP